MFFFDTITMERRMLYVTEDRAEDLRAELHALYMDADAKCAVTTDGHILFASRKDYLPAEAGKRFLTKPWFFDGKLEECQFSVYPDWKKVIPREPKLRVQTRLPDGLRFLSAHEDVRAVFSPEGVHYLGVDEAVEKARALAKTHGESAVRMLNANYFSEMEGQHVNVLWEDNEERYGPAASAVVIVPYFHAAFKESDATANQLIHGEWVWFSVVMPMRYNI